VEEKGRSNLDRKVMEDEEVSEGKETGKKGSIEMREC
jgi:hypothetical protein